MKYTVHGPFEIHKQKNGLVDRSSQAKNEFWDRAREEDGSLPSACGCYLFAVRAAKGIRPWYVGLAERQSFEGECFSSHKLTIYNDVLADRKGTPLLFLVAKRTTGNKFSRPSKKRHRSSRFLESMLIGIVLDKNSRLMNIQKTKFLKEMSVPQVINSPQRRPTGPESKFKKTIGS